MPKVFVTQDTNHNLTPALKYGEVIMLSFKDHPLWDLTLGRQAVLGMKKLLEDYDPTQDYILPLGDPLAIGITFALVAIKHGRVRVLKFDRQNFSYIPLEIAT